MVLSKEELGKKIKEARKKKELNTGRKYTQEMLAKEVDISRSYLGDIEAGRKYPNYVLLSRIAEVLDMKEVGPIQLSYLSELKYQESSTNQPVVSDIFERYNSIDLAKPKNQLNGEELSDDEYAAVKSFLDVYRQQVGRVSREPRKE